MGEKIEKMKTIRKEHSMRDKDRREERNPKRNETERKKGSR